MATRQKLRSKSKFKMATRSVIMSALNKTSKRFLVSLVMNLLSKVSRSVKVTALARIDRAPKKSTGRKRKRRVKARKSRGRKAKTRRKSKTKRSKASIRAQRLGNLKKARAAKRRKSR